MPEIKGAEEEAKIEQEAFDAISRRRKESTEMIEQRRSVTEMLGHFDNDYTPLENLYRQRTGGELLADPYTSPETEVKITKTCSIVIPAYNNSERLENCLRAIQASTFNAKYPQLLEVVVVDDGSPNEDIAERVEAMGLDDLNVKVFRQSNGQVSKGRYSGVLNANGEVVIITDPDIVYTPNMIEEYMKRQQVLDGVVMFGLRDEIDTADERLGSVEGLSSLPQGISADPRVKQDGLADCAWLKESGHNYKLPIDVDDERMNWRAASIAWGMSVCAKREDLLRTFSGYDERYRGYGGDDEDMVSRLMAQGNYLIPLTGALCYHQRHLFGGYDEEKRRQNVETMFDNLGKPLQVQDVDNPKRTDADLKLEQRNNRSEEREIESNREVDEVTAATELLKEGKYAEALASFESIKGNHMGEFWFWYDMSCARIAVGGEENLTRAISSLEYLSREDENSWVHSTLAKAYAKIGDYESSEWHYWHALNISKNEDADLIRWDGDEITEKARSLMKSGKTRMALERLNIAIINAGGPDSADPWLIFDRAVCLERLGDFKLAIDSLQKVSSDLSQNTWWNSRIATVFEKMGNKGEAERYYRAALNIQDDNIEAREGIERIK